MNTSQKRRLRALATLMLASVGAGCAPETIETTDPPAQTFSRVFVLDTESLEPPAVGHAKVFKPAAMLDIDPNDPSAGKFEGFFVTLATRDAEALEVRLLDSEAGSLTAFHYVAPPATPAERELASDPGPFDSTTRELLAGGQGVYWLANSDGQTGELRDRFAMLIPEVILSPFTKLQMFTDAADDGTPIGLAEIELVRDFFYLAIIGDSVLWGSGLEEQDKMSALAAEVIERETHKKVVCQRFAHSGARIVPAEGDSICEVNCSGEVPTASTSITVQADLIEHPELVDLVLMDGCINDVGVPSIIDPEIGGDEFAELIRRFCRDEMTTLIGKVRSLAPQARIVVTGYYPIVGPQSDPFGLQQWAKTHDLELGEEGVQFVNAVTANSLLFHDTARDSLSAAVDAVNEQDAGGPMIAFADPGFGLENSVFAQDSWLWGMSSQSAHFDGIEIDLELFPEDPIDGLRLANCFEPDIIVDVISCVYASVGHPNPTGARAYADAIIEALRDLAVLPAEKRGHL